MEILALRPLQPDAPALSVRKSSDDGGPPWTVEIQRPGLRSRIERFHWLGAALIPASDHLAGLTLEAAYLEMTSETQRFLICASNQNRPPERILLLLGNPQGLRDLHGAAERAGALGAHIEGHADAVRISLGSINAEIVETNGRNVEACIKIRQGETIIRNQCLPLASLRAALPGAVRPDAPNALLRNPDALYVHLPAVLPATERQARALATAFADAGVQTPGLEEGLFGICRAALTASDRLRANGDVRADALERIACMAWRAYAVERIGRAGLRDPLSPLTPEPPSRPGLRLPGFGPRPHMEAIPGR